MKPFKRLKKIKIGCITFDIKWDKRHNGGCFSFLDHKMEVGVREGTQEERIFEIVCHEVMEIILAMNSLRMHREDVDDDYIFVFDHRQFDSTMSQFTGIITQFL